MTIFIKKLNCFDATWYANEYGDVFLSGLSAIDHFRRYGLILNRKPCENWVEDLDGENSVQELVIEKSSNLLVDSEQNFQLHYTGNNGWVALGEDPAFILNRKDFDVIDSPGWYKFSLNIDSEKNKNKAKFYFDLGFGFNENDGLSISYRPKVKAEKIVRISKKMLNMRFDPLETQSVFSLIEFNIIKLTDNSAVDEMLSRISSSHPSFIDQDPRDILKFLSGPEKNDINKEEIIRVYEESFLIDQSDDDYKEWIEKIESPNLPSRDEVLEELNGLTYRPLISIIVPVYNTDPQYLRECLDSVLDQYYPNWELCLADDASPKNHVRTILEEYKNKDSRVKVAYRTNNGHISEASNSALALATGEYIALLDHDDVLAKHALFYVVTSINKNLDALIFYSDEDKVNSINQRFDPYFKSDWNPDLFYSQNYISHLGVYKKSLLEKIHGFRKGVEGSQDYDLFLRCLPYVLSQQIIHIPQILYHWRVLPGSTALGAQEKSYTADAGLKALRDHFSALGIKDIEVELGLIPNSYHVKWPIPEPSPLVSLLIPTRDRKKITEVAVRSILEKTTYSHYEIIIIDNGSVEPETLNFFEEIQKEDLRVKVIRYDHPFNYSAINNFGAQHAAGSILGLVNNDVEVISPDWLAEMVRHAMRKEIGCVGAKLFYGNKTIQHAGVVLGIGGVAGHSHKYFPGDHHGYFGRLSLVQNYSAVTAACLIIRREIYEEVGGLNEKDLAVAFNDVDFCLRVREKGYRNIWSPYASLFHHESISRGSEDNPEKVKRFNAEVIYMKDHWGNALISDPYYSPRLSMDREDFSIGF